MGYFRRGITPLGVSMAGSADPVGHVAELRAIDSVINELCGQTGLLLHGEPGIGKSTLLRAAERRAFLAGYSVLLLTSSADDGGGEPVPLARELFALLGMPPPTSGDGIDEIVRQALERSAAENPTLLLIDGADRCDAISWNAVTRGMRALFHRPISLIATFPDGSPRLRSSGMPLVEVRPMNSHARRELLTALGSHLPTWIQGRIHSAAAGNPMAIAELASADLEQWQRSGLRTPSALPVTPRLVIAFKALAEELPVIAQEVLLVAAANDDSALTEAAAAAARIRGVAAEDALTACLGAFERRLVQGDMTVVQFRSEAARSAVYNSASLPRRHAAHRALSEIVADPDRSAWHRAASNAAPSEDLASQLEQASAHARARGDIAVALAFMDRAVTASTDAVARTERALQAAEYAFQLGRSDLFYTFLPRFAHQSGVSQQQSRVAFMERMYDLYRPALPMQVETTMTVIGQAVANGDREWARTVAAQLNGQILSMHVSQRLQRALLETADSMGGLAAVPALAAPLSVIAPVQRGSEILDLANRVIPEASADPRLGRMMGEAAMALGDVQLALRYYVTSLERFRDAGQFGLLPFGLVDRARALVDAAGLDGASSEAEEALRLASEVGQPILIARAQAVQAHIAGLRGDVAAGESLAFAAEQAAMQGPALLADVYVARGAMYLAAGRHAEAVDWLLRLWEDNAPAMAISRRWSTLADLAHAANAIGSESTVRPMLDELTVVAAAVPSVTLRASVDYARAILTPPQSFEAEDLLLRSRDSNIERGPFWAGRARLAYGTWLRRKRRITPARLELRSALTSFEAVGTTPWAEMARHELRAAGSPAPPGDAGEEGLTAQERLISELAASGLSNREIGERLHLSPRTVGTHLYRVFPKLGVTSRSQLPAALRDGTTA